ncbi:MAG: TIGR02594 family protein, partial [Pseudomonadota bacterium]
MGTKAPWLDYLAHHIGVAEIPGPQHHPLIVEWGREAGIDWWNNDEDAWCAVAVNGALVNSGFPSTRSALARSFLTYGQRLQHPVPGAIAVFPRGTNPLYGHVGIIETVHGDGTFTVVNGNVSNEVRRSRFKAASVLPEGLRWP